MIRYERCPVCSSTEISTEGNITDYSVTGESFPIFKCAACELIFTQTVPDPAYIGKYYASQDYISHSDTHEGFINKMYHRVRKLTLETKRKIITDFVHKQSGMLLDYGCGTGAFLNEMRTYGWTVTGLEPDEGARKKAKELYELIVTPETDLAVQKDKYFDAITLWHVLEHVYDLHGTIKHLTRISKPGGKIFIAVPNYKSRDAEIYKEFWAAWDVPRHLYHFSPKSIETLMEAHGFKVVDTLPMWFDSFYVSMLSEKYKKSKFQIPRAIISGLRSNINALSNKGTCSSQIYVCERKAKLS